MSGLALVQSRWFGKKQEKQHNTSSIDWLRPCLSNLKRPDTPRMESLVFVQTEGAKNSEAFARYVAVEFSLATNILQLSADGKLQLIWP
ncbi:MAG: hypothetical protein H7249_04140 [Chitinophagaceae bacterium]|nr:hypothetical protein [Oligoflexus sp.]